MAFNIPNQTSFSPQKPVATAAAWNRPGDWISITDAPNIVQFLVSDAVYPAYSIQTTFTQTGGVGNIYIDWGDGTSTTVSTTTATNSEKTYTSGGTYSTQGYNTWKITISGDAGTRITLATFVNPTYWGSGNQFPNGLLEEYYGDNTLITLSGLHFVSTTKPNFTNLYYSKLPETITGATSAQNAYINCANLQRVVLPTSMPGLAACDSFFSGCLSLQSVTFPQDATAITNLSSAFNTCNSLTGVTLPPTLNSVTNLTSTFSGCFSLGNLILPATPSNALYSSTFLNCYNLLNIEIKSFGTSASIDTQNMFNSCVSLEYIKLPTTVNGASVFNAAQMFQTCRSLKSCILPTNMNCSSLANTFNNCSSLAYVSLPTSMASLTTMSNTFNGCNDLPSVILPTTVGATIALDSIFQNCFSLNTATIPSGYTITTLASSFSSCSSLGIISLPTGAQNSITSLSSTFFNCVALKSLTLPSSMNAVTTMSGTFQGCSNLISVTYPSTMNSVTTCNNLHTSNSNLLSVTLPTSMSSVTVFAGAFNGCNKLLSLTMPATVSASLTSYINLCQNNWSLKSVVLPTTQTTALVGAGSGANSMFNLCYSLTGITNTDKLGNNTASGTYPDFTSFGASNFELNGSYTFTSRMTRFIINGTVSRISKITGLRMTNTSTGQWGGASPQIDISYTSLSTAALNTLFADIAAQGNVTSKTINITGAVGAAGLTAGDRLVLTSKGWTITG